MSTTVIHLGSSLLPSSSLNKDQLISTSVAPSKVFHHAPLPMHAVSSYLTISPSPLVQALGGLFCFCGTFSQPSLRRVGWALPTTRTNAPHEKHEVQSTKHKTNFKYTNSKRFGFRISIFVFPMRSTGGVRTFLPSPRMA